MAKLDCCDFKMDVATTARLASELWRIERWLRQHPAETDCAPARYAVRTMRAILEGHGIGAIDLTGTLYEPGLAVTVVATDSTDCAGPVATFISETILPIITLNGEIIQRGEVVTAHCFENQTDVKNHG